MSIANLIVRVGAKAGHARFEQTFASKDGRFKDVGPKVLKVIRSAAGLWLIHSEKMLASHVVHDQPKPLGRHDVPKRLLDKLRKDHKNVGLRFSWAARQRIGKGKASGVVLYMEEHDPHPDKGSYHSGHDPDLEGVFALLKHDSATWSVVASAKIRAGYGTNLSVTQLDVDGDGVKDMLINGRSSRFHHNWQHMVFVSSRYPGIEPIFYNETEGEGGFSSGNTTDVACLVRIGDTVALVRDADKYETEIDIEGPDHKTIKDDHTFTTEVKLWSAKGASKPGSLYGYKVVSAETDSAVLAAWRKRTGAGKKDSPLHEDLTLCGKPADPVFVLHDERGFHLVAGLSLTEKAAKAAAKAAGRPASSVIEM